MSESISQSLTQAIQSLEQARRLIRKHPTSLSKRQINAIIRLQHDVVNLRDDAIRLMRRQDHLLEDISFLFDISPSRVSQISRGLKPAKTARFQKRKR